MAYSTISGMPDAYIERLWANILKPRWDRIDRRTRRYRRKGQYRGKLSLLDQEVLSRDIISGYETVARASRDYQVSRTTIRKILKRHSKITPRVATQPSPGAFSGSGPG
jgi:hypothetical protein